MRVSKEGKREVMKERKKRMRVYERLREWREGEQIKERERERAYFFSSSARTSK